MWLVDLEPLWVGLFSLEETGGNFLNRGLDDVDHLTEAIVEHDRQHSGDTMAPGYQGSAHTYSAGNVNCVKLTLPYRERSESSLEGESLIKQAAAWAGRSRSISERYTGESVSGSYTQLRWRTNPPVRFPSATRARTGCCCEERIARWGADNSLFCNRIRDNRGRVMAGLRTDCP